MFKKKSKAILKGFEQKKEPLKKLIKADKCSQTFIIEKNDELVQNILWSLGKKGGVVNVVVAISNIQALVKQNGTLMFRF